jgi:3-hydroxy-3-methylglutaryl CoA synthase
MVGITSCGAYIPLNRLSKAEISRAWGGSPVPGEKAVANWDEDVVTMAVAAGMDCLNGMDPKTLDGLYLASTTFPYLEKQSAALAATALDLRQDAFTVDFSNSLRCGASAMKVAVDAVAANSARRILVCVADTRLGMPHGPYEMDFGDGAAALILGNTGVIAAIEGVYSVMDEITDVWRPDNDVFVHSWEERFVREKGYARVVPEAVSAALQKYQLTPKDFAKAIFCAPHPSLVTQVARQLGFDVKTQVQDILFDKLGNTGAALSLMLLVAALEEARAGDRILLVNYGDGCDVLILRVTEEIKKVGDRKGIKRHLASKLELGNYQRYLEWRHVLPTQTTLRPGPEQPSAVALLRDRKRGLALYGVKCNVCGTPQYPPEHVCVNCGTRDQFEDYRFAGRRGVLFTFSQDSSWAGVSMDVPVTVTAVDMEGGGRIICDMTDRDPEQVKVGMPVEMTFRKLRRVGGVNNYWWKCQPVRV